jgi:hypothetical protein
MVNSRWRHPYKMLDFGPPVGDNDNNLSEFVGLVPTEFSNLELLVEHYFDETERHAREEEQRRYEEKLRRELEK